MLSDNETADRGLALVTEEALASPRCRAVFRLIGLARAGGFGVEPDVLETIAREHDLTMEVTGGRCDVTIGEVMLSLHGDSLGPHYLDQYADQVKRDARLREARDAAFELHQAATPSAAQIERLGAAMKALTEPSEAPQVAAIPFAELMAQAPTEVEWVVDRIVPAGGLVCWAGDSGAAKTWALGSMALSVACGELPFLGQFGTRQGGVLIWDEESPQGLMAQRLQKLARGMDVAGAELPLWLLDNPGLRIDEERDRDVLRRLLDRHRPALLLVDSLVGIHGQNENDAGAMRMVGRLLRDVARECGCAVMFTHHARKEPAMAVRAPTSSAAARIRGSTDIRAVCDSVFFVNQVDADVFTVEQVKNRLAPAMVETFAVRLEDNEDQTVTTMTHVGKYDEAAAEADRAADFVTAYVEQQGGRAPSRQSLVEAALAEGFTGRTAQRGISKAVAEGRLVAGEREGRQVPYMLPDLADEGGVEGGLGL